jgi:hypothetical protein
VKGENLQVDLIFPARGKENRKLGWMPVAYIDKASCPTACVLKGLRGCYAEYGPVSWHWNKVSAGLIGDDWLTFCDKVVSRIGPRSIWRYGVAGDLPGLGDLIRPHDMDLLIAANMRRPVIAYTHKPVFDVPEALSNRRTIADAITKGFMINLSADGVDYADRLISLDLAPVVVILPNAYGRREKSYGSSQWLETIGEYRDRIATLPTHTPARRRIAICPATYTDAKCSTCRACSKPRDAIIGFPAHRAGAKKAELAHLVARDVVVGEPWVFPEHRTMAEVIAEETAAA